MKKRYISALAAGAIVLTIGSLITYQTWPRTIEGPREPMELILEFPPAPQNSEIRISQFSTGHNISPEALIYTGGNFFEQHQSVYSGFVVEHPQSTFILEGGIGTNIAREHAENFDFFYENLFAYTATETAKELLAANGKDQSDVDFIALTHLHWDHAAIIPDFLDTPILVTEHELSVAREEAVENQSYFQEYLINPETEWEFLEFTDGPYGPFDKSKDMFGDQTVIAVPMAGHTAGSMGFVVTAASGKRYFFIGDTSWSIEAIEKAHPRLPFAENIVDHDVPMVHDQLWLLQQIMKANPDLMIVPTHDGNVVKQISAYPAFE